MIYSEAERKEIERVYGVFKDYIHASKFLDFVWSEKLGYLLLHIDPTKNTIEEDQIITSADELCAELSRTFPFSKRYSYIEGQKEPSIPLRTLKAEYPNHRLHKTDLAATQGASAGASRL